MNEKMKQEQFDWYVQQGYDANLGAKQDGAFEKDPLHVDDIVEIKAYNGDIVLAQVIQVGWKGGRGIIGKIVEDAGQYKKGDHFLGVLKDAIAIYPGYPSIFEDEHVAKEVEA